VFGVEGWGFTSSASRVDLTMRCLTASPRRIVVRISVITCCGVRFRAKGSLFDGFTTLDRCSDFRHDLVVALGLLIIEFN